jgi:predicted peptidase
MKNLKPLLFYFAFFLCGYANKSFSQTSVFSHEMYISETGDTLLYRMVFPDLDTLRKYPLVVFLHGLGERGHDNESQLRIGVMNFADDKISAIYPAFIIAPQCPKNMFWANVLENRARNEIHLQPSPSSPMKLLIELVQKLKNELPVDSNRIYITGLSMGGFGTYDAIERYPNLFAAAVPVCGAGDTSKAASISHIPIWIFHGAEDPTVSVLYSHYMLEALTRAGAHPGFTQYPEVGHFSPKSAYTDQQMFAWLFRQHK